MNPDYKETRLLARSTHHTNILPAYFVRHQIVGWIPIHFVLTCIVFVMFEKLILLATLMCKSFGFIQFIIKDWYMGMASSIAFAQNRDSSLVRLPWFVQKPVSSWRMHPLLLGPLQCSITKVLLCEEFASRTALATQLSGTWRQVLNRHFHSVR